MNSMASNRREMELVERSEDFDAILRNISESPAFKEKCRTHASRVIEELPSDARDEGIEKAGSKEAFAANILLDVHKKFLLKIELNLTKHGVAFLSALLGIPMAVIIKDGLSDEEVLERAKTLQQDALEGVLPDVGIDFPDILD